MSEKKPSLAMLLAEQEKLNEKIEIARKREATGVIQRVREAMRIYGLTPADFAFETEQRKTPAKKIAIKKRAKKSLKFSSRGPAPGTKKPPKYTDGEHTWAGGGSTPRWLREKIEQGHKLEEFLIVKAA